MPKPRIRGENSAHCQFIGCSPDKSGEVVLSTPPAPESGVPSIASIMGSGGALFDFDQDGDLDLFMRQGAAGDSPGNHLYRDLLRETGRLRFEPAQSFPLRPGTLHGMGVAL